MMTPARTDAARILLAGGVRLNAIAELAWQPWGYASRDSLRTTLRRLDLPQQALLPVSEYNLRQVQRIILAVSADVPQNGTSALDVTMRARAV